MVIIILFGISAEFSLHCNCTGGGALFLCWLRWGQQDTSMALGNIGGPEHINPLRLSLRRRKNEPKV